MEDVAATGVGHVHEFVANAKAEICVSTLSCLPTPRPVFVIEISLTIAQRETR